MIGAPRALSLMCSQGSRAANDDRKIKKMRKCAISAHTKPTVDMAAATLKMKKASILDEQKGCGSFYNSSSSSAERGSVSTCNFEATKNRRSSSAAFSLRLTPRPPPLLPFCPECPSLRDDPLCKCDKTR